MGNKGGAYQKRRELRGDKKVDGKENKVMLTGPPVRFNRNKPAEGGQQCLIRYTPSVMAVNT